MLKRLVLPAVVASFAAFAGTSGAAVAAPLFASPQATHLETGTASNVIEIRNDRRKDRRANRKYDRRIHGDRCTRRAGGCRHYYGGYYYHTPWWLVRAPFVGAQIVIGNNHRSSASRHVRWCEDRYRSYNRRTNTWVAYSGEVRQCVSPYR